MKLLPFLKTAGFVILETAVSAVLFLNVCAAENSAENSVENSAESFVENFAESSVENSVNLDSLSNEIDEQNGIRMSFSYGFHNIAKSGRLLPFEADITNGTGSDIDGRFVIRAAGSVETERNEFASAEAVYSFDASLKAGEQTRIEGTISVAETDSPAAICFYNAQNELLFEKQIRMDIREENNAELLVGLIAADPEQLSYFDSVSLEGTGLKTKTVELDPAELPADSRSLEQLDLLVLSGVSGESFSPESLDAMYSWIERGGALLVGTGNSGAAAELFGAETGGISIGVSEEAEVNMGLKYSKTGPDDAVLDLTVSPVLAQNGIQVLQSDDIAMLTTISAEKGVIGITAFDLGDISSFCLAEPEYTSDLLKALLGSVRIAQYSRSMDNEAAYYQDAESLVNIVDPERLPAAALFILFSICSICFTAFGIYYLLRSRGLGIFYHIFVPAASFMISLFFWTACSGLRNDGVGSDYALIREYHSASVEDSGFIRFSSASLDTYEIDSEGSCLLQPLFRNPAASDRSLPPPNRTGSILPEAEQEETSLIEVLNSENSIRIREENMKPFSGVLTQYSRERKLEKDEKNIECHLNFFNGTAEGTLVNHTEQELSDAVLLICGKAARIGTVGAGETVELKDLEFINSPVGNGRAAAEYMTDLGQYEEGSGEYVRRLQRSRLLAYYINHALNNYYSEARLIAFTDGKDALESLSAGSTVEEQGTMLVVSFVDADYHSGNSVWTEGLKTEPVCVFGEYDAATNTVTGSCILEYTLGNDLQISSVSFGSMDPVFADDMLLPYSGTTAVYNYETDVYDYIKTEGNVLTGESIQPYLSPGNTITIRYTPDGTLHTGQRMYLPVLDVTGKEK